MTYKSRTSWITYARAYIASVCAQISNFLRSSILRLQKYCLHLEGITLQGVCGRLIAKRKAARTVSSRQSTPFWRVIFPGWRKDKRQPKPNSEPSTALRTHRGPRIPRPQPCQFPRLRPIPERHWYSTASPRSALNCTNSFMAQASQSPVHHQHLDKCCITNTHNLHCPERAIGLCFACESQCWRFVSPAFRDAFAIRCYTTLHELTLPWVFFPYTYSLPPALHSSIINSIVAPLPSNLAACMLRLRCHI